MERASSTQHNESEGGKLDNYSLDYVASYLLDKDTDNEDTMSDSLPEHRPCLLRTNAQATVQTASQIIYRIVGETHEMCRKYMKICDGPAKDEFVKNRLQELKVLSERITALVNMKNDKNCTFTEDIKYLIDKLESYKPLIDTDIKKNITMIA